MSTELVRMDMGLSQIADAFARSGMFSDARDQAQAITKIIAGQSLGLDPFSAMSGLYVVKGKVSVGAHLIAAAIKRSTKYDYRVTAKTDTRCSVTFYEAGQELGSEEWTIQQAQKAGLTGNKVWQSHPAAMLFARAISSGYRTYCPDVFSTPVYVEGELDEAPTPPKFVQATVVEPPPVVVEQEPEEDPLQPLCREVDSTLGQLRNLDADKASEVEQHRTRWESDLGFARKVLTRLEALVAEALAKEEKPQPKTLDDLLGD